MSEETQAQEAPQLSERAEMRQTEYLKNKHAAEKLDLEKEIENQTAVNQKLTAENESLADRVAKLEHVHADMARKADGDEMPRAEVMGQLSTMRLHSTISINGAEEDFLQASPQLRMRVIVRGAPVVEVWHRSSLRKVYVPLSNIRSFTSEGDLF